MVHMTISALEGIDKIKLFSCSYTISSMDPALPCTSLTRLPFRSQQVLLAVGWTHEVCPQKIWNRWNSCASPPYCLSL